MAWPVLLLLNKQVYSLGVAQRAVYSVARNYMVEVRPQDDQLILLVSPSTSSTSAHPTSPEAAKEQLLQALNDFALRERIQQETAGIRETLIRAAFAGCSN